MEKLLRTLRSGGLAAAPTGLLVFLIVLAAREAGWLQQAELHAYDRCLRAGRARPAGSSPVLLVQIQEEDIQAFGHPLSDRLLGRVIARIVADGPRAIGVDVYRDLAQGEGRDELAALVTGDPRIVMIEKAATREEGGLRPPEFVEDHSQIGFSDLVPDAGGVVRRGLLILWDESGRPSLSLALQLALRYLADVGIGLVPDPVRPEYVRLGETTIPRFRGDDGSYVGADDGGYQFLLDFARGRAAFGSVSLSAVLTGELPPGALRDKIVVLGTTAASVKDRHHTPLTSGRSEELGMFGAEIHAHGVDQLLRIGLEGERPLAHWSEGTEALWILGWSLLGALLGVGPPRRLKGAPTWGLALGLSLAAALALAAPLAGGFLAFRLGVWIPAVPAALAALGAAVLTVSHGYLLVYRERAFIMRLFGIYVSEEVAHRLWEQRDEFLHDGRPQPRRLLATVLMSDLRGYTAASEKMDPAQLMDWVNSYMDAMTRLVEQHGGVVDDYAGDGIKANFGVPVARSGEREIDADAVNAVRCALAMGRELEQLDVSWRAQHMPTARMRIGIASGELVVGSLGSAHRLKYTSVGDTVNTASRLESFDKEAFEHEVDDSTCRILISGETWRRVRGRFRVRELGAHALRGRGQSTEIYRVLDEVRGEPDEEAEP